jgi:DNA repair exonuclease SbcCD ATPase subunit
VSSDDKCPACSKPLEDSERKIVAKQLEKSVSQRYREELRKNKQENAAMIAEYKEEQKEQLQAMAKKYQDEKTLLQKRTAEQEKKDRDSQKREIAEMRRNYQAQVEHLREFYGTQNTALQNELKASFAAQLEAMKKNYEGLAAGNQRQLETLQKYIEDKFVGELKAKVSQLEVDKASAEMRLSEMVQELDQRNAEVVSLKEQLNRADIMPTGRAKPQIMSDNLEPGNVQEELLKMVKEVAQQREVDDYGEPEEEEEDAEDEDKRRFWGSKPGKKFGLF